MINLDWNVLWKIASDNAITSGIVSETVVNVMNKMFDSIINGELKVQEAYFKEKNFGNKINLALPWELVNHEYSSIVGEHKQEHYIYAETGDLLFSLKKNIKKLQNVTLIYSNDDINESVHNIKEFCHSLTSEKLNPKSRKGMPRFRSKCELFYISKNSVRIKNSLICVNGGKKGYDLFVLQTIQSPLGKYTTSFTIDDSRKTKDIRLEAPLTLIKKRDFGITSRIVLLNDLSSMMNPFFVNNRKVIPGEETEAFKLFIDSFKSAYELRAIKLGEETGLKKP
ncbi:hypothetical protein [Ligilactobacillus salivarius]|nr:hypothetical protein [Ligilactobacillus salivarius]MDE1507738.1 hypothetical protein [Ligilactobacillus salivarius]MDE1522140.1 hypothetical protein [Ligilactobacillus salivarius]